MELDPRKSTLPHGAFRSLPVPFRPFFDFGGRQFSRNFVWDFDASRNDHIVWLGDRRGRNWELVVWLEFGVRATSTVPDLCEWDDREVGWS